MTYREKLNSIPWRNKRQEILIRDNFTCQNCKEIKLPVNNLVLHVHHKNYLFKAEPWDYENEYLVTLCEDCHSMEEDYKNQVSAQIDYLHLSGVSYFDIFEFLISKQDEFLNKKIYGQKV